jgi:hypothetical protein
MNDGHTGLENSKVNEGGSGSFSLVLSCLKQVGRADLVVHASSNVSYSFGLQHYDFLKRIGFKSYIGECQFFHDHCFYFVKAVTQRPFNGMENFSQVQSIHDSFKSFAANIDQLFSLCQQEENILREIGLKSSSKTLIGEPTQIEISEGDIPLWIQEVKFPQLLELEQQKDALQTQIDTLSQYLPLLYGSGDTLETAVLESLKFLGLEAEKTEKGFTVDIRAQTPDGTKKFGLEVTGINGQVKKGSPKLTQVMEFERLKEHDEKTIIVANTHNKTPISKRKGLEDFTPQVLTFLERNTILIITGWDLYCMVRDTLSSSQSKEKLIEMLYTSNGRLKYGD